MSSDRPKSIHTPHTHTPSHTLAVSLCTYLADRLASPVTAAVFRAGRALAGAALVASEAMAFAALTVAQALHTWCMGHEACERSKGRAEAVARDSTGEQPAA